MKIRKKKKHARKGLTRSIHSVSKLSRRKDCGFTLSEILIVVVIFGILSAILVPQFSMASSGAKEESLKDNLAKVRSQIDLFKVQHSDLLPGQAIVGGNVTGSSFVKALTGDNVYGPYVRAIPRNYFVVDAKKQATITCVNDPSANPTGYEGTAWWFNAATGDFRACDSPEHVGL